MSQDSTAMVGYLIKRAQSVLHDAMADSLAPLGLTLSQYAVLSGLAEEPGLSNAGLARRVFVTPQSMHAVLRELEQRRFVVRHPAPLHRRVLQAELTESGRRALSVANSSVTKLEETMLHPLSSPERSALARALSLCIDSLVESSAPSRIRTV